MYVCIILQHLQAALAGHALAALAAPGGVRVPSHPRHPRHRLSWRSWDFRAAEHVNSQTGIRQLQNQFSLARDGEAMRTNANQCL